ncbi:HAD-like protein [Coccomyxa subellipsoidea C-169]|uniref:HAD-like protein n=1 Tax=Coccomyxa subellipsoidea (strain C-169) TaxID=574566 RepID=I0ZA22_COCSC|nr:HAD-like protein [Coccomyxa subellipsoidea C-169]EIE27491.1 HAD-like protein [Coccomyxa subellipsoidea C-169]|eukprot:XP_005652035.1 HAD-like protein [Coccomyxa subellipsoidea C-169]
MAKAVQTLSFSRTLMPCASAMQVDAAALLKAWKERFLKAPWDVNHKEMVEELKGQGLKVVIITNGHPQIQRGKLERLQASSMFDAILVGGEEIAAGGREKPAASIFLKACQLAGCLPSEAVHIGDSLAADIRGGINATLAATVWVNKHGHPLPRGAPVPSYTVSHVTELPGVLNTIDGSDIST